MQRSSGSKLGGKFQTVKQEFQAERFFSDATSAQIFEGVSINNTPSDEGYLMNSKAEYQQGEVARVVVMRGLAE